MNSRLYWELVFTKAKLNLKAEASKSYLSYIWWVLEPAMYVAVLYLVFNSFRTGRIEHFVVFIVCGQVPFSWFSRSVRNCMQAIFGGRGLMNQIHIPKSFFPILVIFQDLFKSLMVFVTVLVFLVIYGIEPSFSWLSLPAIIVVQLLLITPCAFISAMTVPFIPDLRFVISTGLILLMFCSGIFYDYQVMIAPEYQHIFLLNPMARLIENYREVLMYGNWPDWNYLFILSLISIIVQLLILSLLRRIDRHYPRIVLQ